MVTALEIAFWLSAGLILWTQLGYAIALWLLFKLLGTRKGEGARAHAFDPHDANLPSISLIVAAHDEQDVIAAKVCNALELRYPREKLEIVIACDGCEDETGKRAREAGADLVLELPRGGKIRAQDAAVAATGEGKRPSEIVTFSDANASWEPNALLELAGAFRDPDVGYACGQVRFVQAGSGRKATNQEGLYWRYEMAVRELESRLSSITAGNGAIYATRRSSYLVVDPVMGHDLSFPFNIVKRGERAVYVASALAMEKMVPSIEGERARKRRMMAHTWAILLKGGMLSLGSYPPLYASMIVSHRLLRYLTPFLHLIALGCNVALLALAAGPLSGSSSGPALGPLYVLTLALQAAVLLGAALGRSLHWRALLIARYYVLTTASLAVGLWDWLRQGVSASWEAAEGTR